MKLLYYADMVLGPMIVTALLEYHVVTFGFHKSLFLFVFAGVVLWSFAEYTIHRSLHIFKSESHAGHHARPRDQSGPSLFMTIVIFLAVYGVLFLALGTEMAIPIHAGTLSGYVVYLFAHNRVHFIGAPDDNLHVKHHNFPRRDFGVITPFWDYIFGTYR